MSDKIKVARRQAAFKEKFIPHPHLIEVFCFLHFERYRKVEQINRCKCLPLSIIISFSIKYLVRK